VNHHPGANPYRIYREQQVTNLSPGRLVLLAYDTALRACRTGRRGLLTQVLHELIAGLDLDQGEIASGLLSLYEYALRQAREGRLEDTGALLQDLRDAWARAVQAEEAKAHLRPGEAALATARSA